jgi:hypothetical protein
MTLANKSLSLIIDSKYRLVGFNYETAPDVIQIQLFSYEALESFILNALILLSIS